MHVYNVREFTHTKFNSEIKAPFLLNGHGDRHFLFYKFNENNILNNWEKKLAEIYGYFFLAQQSKSKLFDFEFILCFL